MRYKFVATEVKRFDGYQTLTPSTQAQYIDSQSVSFQPDGTTTLIIDNLGKVQYRCSQTYSTIITRLDTASPSTVANQIDLS